MPGASEEELFERTRTREQRPLPARERRIEAGLSAALLAVVAVLWLTVPHGPSFSPGLAVLLVAAYAACHHVRFWVGGASTAPTQLVLVAMLVLVPTPLVPLLAFAGMVGARAEELLRGKKHPDRLLLLLPDAAFTVAPVLVIALLGQDAVGGRHVVGDAELLSVFALAMVAQFCADAALGTLRERLIFGAAPSLDLGMFARIAAADAALAPVALVLALAARDNVLAIAAVLPLVALLNVFAREREQRLSSAVELSAAYRGTALLMNDLLQLEDAYTGGEHSRGVVALALEVGRNMALSPTALRELEFGAMLHDIGKIHVPSSILNKPGKLNAEEWATIKRHPEDGQLMLQRVGGVLGEVGAIVRSHHEFYDGSGYPDGLAAQQIPLAARIICACDAFSAMTTTRSYRAAMSFEAALVELRRCASSQFDPLVVAELAAVVGAPTAASVALPVVRSSAMAMA